MPTVEFDYCEGVKQTGHIRTITLQLTGLGEFGSVLQCQCSRSKICCNDVASFVLLSYL